VHWRAGADWLFGHLLDGDLASNHLSWQWVAATGSSKPYLFNADNVARYAPAPWHSPGSVIDTSYEALDQMARSGAHSGAHSAPGHVARQAMRCGPGERDGHSPEPSRLEPLLRAVPGDLTGITAPDATTVAGRDVWLVHPWSLGELPGHLPADTQVIGIFVADFHRAWPWSERRWNFAGNRMAELTHERWYGEAADIGAALKGARRVRSIDEPHLAPWLASWAECSAAPALFPAVDRRCDSFSQWWHRASRGMAAVSSNNL
jgi:deoxyribodipyrimidine photo-lyase